MRWCILIGVTFISTQVLAQDYHNRPVDPQKTDCHKLPLQFEDLKEAIKLLESATYRFTEQFKTGKTDGVTAAKFYSCDHEIGFLALKVDGKYIIYYGMNKEIWDGLTQSNDLDKYFQEHIKDKLAVSVSED